MLIRQRATFADDFLLQVVFPYLHENQATHLMRLAHFWNDDAGPGPRPTSSQRPAGRLYYALRRLAHGLLAPAAKVSAN
jgi:hypothetical protein